MNNHISSLESPHIPVMLNEVIKISSPLNGGIFIDCTFGGGGYSKQLLKFSKTIVKGLDRDSEVKEIGKKLEKKFPKRFKFYQTTFSKLENVTEGFVDVIIFDLGLSSIQLNDLKRGFSFKSNEKLDMSMGLNKISAQDVINNLSELKLKLIIKILGEEKEAARIAKNIVKSRNKKKIIKVKDLVHIIESSKKMKQSYMFMSLNNDDYLVIRGKKSILQEAYVFQVIEQGLLRYTEDCKPYMTFRVVCKVPFEIYDKLEARRSSFWKLLPRDFKEIKELV